MLPEIVTDSSGNLQDVQVGKMHLQVPLAKKGSVSYVGSHTPVPSAALALSSVLSYRCLRQATEQTTLISPHLFKTVSGFLLPPPAFSCVAFSDWNSFGWE